MLKRLKQLFAGRAAATTHSHGQPTHATTSESEPIQRGILPDVRTDDQVVLFKAPRYLRLTYEIRLATYMATTRGLHLTISVPSHTTFSAELQAFIGEHRIGIRRGER
jgi:hypothetical protein